ncbi:MAG: hypothetical protein DRI99_02740 [Candidatus Aminicenantes bacterium]|nr:MAG: hypothetical protein DRJ11_04760 [Candidatus Aminicenantes bacterium]RLE05119.1 MAG: hypothetical protein DRI99_02740 [Candidatus Aminicenantes bacterium]
MDFIIFSPNFVTLQLSFIFFHFAFIKPIAQNFLLTLIILPLNVKLRKPTKLRPLAGHFKKNSKAKNLLCLEPLSPKRS